MCCSIGFAGERMFITGFCDEILVSTVFCYVIVLLLLLKQLFDIYLSTFFDSLEDSALFNSLECYLMLSLFCASISFTLNLFPYKSSTWSTELARCTLFKNIAFEARFCSSDFKVISTSRKVLASSVSVICPYVIGAAS